MKRYRDDKPASQADSIGFVRELFERSLGGVQAEASESDARSEGDPEA